MDPQDGRADPVLGGSRGMILKSLYPRILEDSEQETQGLEDRRLEDFMIQNKTLEA